MSHLDEGMIHELLDGELPPDEARAARSHLVTCAECRALYEEAKEFFAESERLVAALDASDGLVSRPPAIPRPTGSPLGPSRPSRGLPLRTMAWAASIFLAISLGYYGSDFRNRAKSKEEAPANVVVAPPQQPENAPAVAEPPAAPPSAATSPTGQERRKQAAPAEKLQRTDQLAAKDLDKSATGFRAESTASVAQGRVEAQAENETDLRSNAVADEAAPSPQAAGLSAAAAPSVAAKVAGQAQPPPFRRIPMEEAVRQLGGTIRLIEGMTPDRVETGSGQLVAGARPGLSLVRVIYLDPPRREIWLDQQHGAGAAAAGADTIIVPSPSGAESLQWRPAPGEWLSLTGFLTADSLRALARRVK
jgi:hypothetical protein